MNEKMIFCEECRKDVAYTVTEIIMTEQLKDESYEFKGKAAFCSECGAEVYVPEIEDANLKALYDAYRQRHGIISLEKILAIPKKYGIGKRPLSVLLGWGESTFSRYCEGDMPSPHYSELLEKIYNEPAFYRNLLENNKAKLKSPTAYEKSKQVTDQLLGDENRSPAKIDSVIDYLLCRCEDITPLALQKALYYVQGFHYAFMGEFIFEEDCEAWAHGPVYRDIYKRYSAYRFDPIEGGESCDETRLSNYEKAVVDSIVRNLCCYSGKILEGFTHSEAPWLRTRGDLSVAAASNRIIHKKVMAEYFTAVKDRYQMINPSDIDIYGKAMFAKIN